MTQLTQNKNGVMSLPIPVNIAQSKNTPKPVVYTMGKKHYESVDWLGNVRVTYTDKKSWNNGKFALNVSSSLDYYPFGAVMEGRKYNLTAYRYAFNTQERVPELNENHYTALYWEYDGRLARRWNVDPVIKSNESAYEVNSNNPVTNNDPNGDCDNCETKIGGKISAVYTFGTRGQSGFRFSAGVGGFLKSGTTQAGLNLSFNLYNSGLGTSQGATGIKGMQADFIVSPSITFGSGEASPMAINTFNSMSLSGITNTFENSGTIASNFVFNSGGRNQQVGSIGGRFGDFSFNIYNDFFPGIGDRNDRYWTGGGSGDINLGKGNVFSFGTEVFTGLRIGNKDEAYKLDLSNPANGRYGTYAQTISQKNLNNGQTFFRLTTSNGLQFGVNFSGGGNSGYSQAIIHNYLPGIKSPEFDYSLSKPSIQTNVGFLLR